MPIALIGYRGSGKSTVGRLLADRLGMNFADTDELIIQRARKNIREIFEQDGEPVFRDLESSVVAEVCTWANSVISFGGGALDREKNRAVFLKASHHQLIYLKCEPEVLFQRIADDPKTAAVRPHLTKLGGGLDEIVAVLTRREPIWESIMTAEVDVTRLTPVQVVEKIVGLL